MSFISSPIQFHDPIVLSFLFSIENSKASLVLSFDVYKKKIIKSKWDNTCKMFRMMAGPIVITQQTVLNYI